MQDAKGTGTQSKKTLGEHATVDSGSTSTPVKDGALTVGRYREQASVEIRLFVASFRSASRNGCRSVSRMSGI